jgi:ATP-dependent Clp protease ATP-binding subunit ClpC
MFERFTEKARRVIFFARYEAAQAGSEFIETEHLLLGLIREYKGIRSLLPNLDYDTVRQSLPTVSAPRDTKADLPMSDESKRVLAYSAEEADRLSHRYIGTEHLLLGLLRESGSVAADLLTRYGADLGKLREEIAQRPAPWPTTKFAPARVSVRQTRN